MKNLNFIVVFLLTIFVTFLDAKGQVVSTDVPYINMITNGGAENGKAGWRLFKVTPADPFTYTIENHPNNSKDMGRKFFRFSTVALNGEGWIEHIFQNLATTANKQCVLSVTYKAAIDDSASIVYRLLDPSDNVIAAIRPRFTVNNTWQTESIFMPCPAFSTLKFRAYYDASSFNLTHDFDNVTFQEVNKTIHRGKFYYKGIITSAAPTVVLSDNNTDFTPVQNGSLLLSKIFSRPNASYNARITCAATVAATGSSCTGGDEQAGIEVDIPGPGLYKVCANFTVFTNNLAEQGSYMIAKTEILPGFPVGPDSNTETIFRYKSNATNDSFDNASFCQEFNFRNQDYPYPVPIAFRVYGLRTGSSSGNGLSIQFNVSSNATPFTMTVEEL